jgi:hypothetical protein
MSHTPGPWQVGELNGKYYGTDVLTESGELIVYRLGSSDTAPSERATPNGYDGHYERAETLANARLIAAAPDLLAALKALVAGVERDDNPLDEGHFQDSPEMEDARAAIAKAEGHSTALPVPPKA